MSPYDVDLSEPYAFIETPGEPGQHPVPPEFRERILVHTVHDGAGIPREFRLNRRGTPIVDPGELDRRYVEERDWGAGTVARQLSQALGIPGFYEVRVARVLLDFNRFPGTTPPRSYESPLDRLAINQPFAKALSHPQKLSLLEDYYDRISARMEEALPGKLILVSLHTYDERNLSLTKRPDVSIISQTATYQRESRMPYGVFDPLYPDVLGESTSSRTLVHRISLNLERAGVRVGHNHPYLLPDGAVDARAQVWYFFRFLRQRFEAALPKTREDPAFRLVWTMLLNTNLRLAESEALRGYLHRYRHVRPRDRARFREAAIAYERIRSFLHETSVVSDYRRSPDRPSCVTLEVRKDLLASFDPAGGWPTRQVTERAQLIARTIAEAISIYLETDRHVTT